MWHKTIWMALAIVLGSVQMTASSNPNSNSNFSVAVGKTAPVSVQPGDIRCIGGEPTNLAFPNPPCTPETKRIFTRGSVQVWMPLAGSLSGPAADMFQGPISFEVNCNLDASYRGRCWGTLEWSVPALNGQWEGSWNGEFDLVTYVVSMSAVAQGSGGLDGMQMKLEGVSTGPEYITFTARVH